MEKKSKVTSVVHNTRQFSSTYGQMFVHQVVFENGDKGDYSSKSDTCKAFVIGQEATYTIETKTNGQFTNTIIKPVKENNFGGGKGGFQRSGNESFALAYSKDVLIASWSSDRIDAVRLTTEQMFQLADKMYNWLEDKKSK